MNFFENMETTQEFTPKQMEAQEAMAETTERTEAAAEAVENTPEYWQKLAQQELDMYGDSDAYREYAAKAGQSGSGEISFGASMTKSEIEKEIKWEQRKYDNHISTANRMRRENAEGSVYNPKNLISDHQWQAKQNLKRISELEKDLKKAPK